MTQTWEFDHYVGVKRAEELGLWKSNDDPERTWTVTGKVTLETSDNDVTFTLTVTADTQSFTIEGEFDQWGTWYGIGDSLFAQEEGKRSFLDALIKGVTAMRKYDPFSKVDATDGSTTR